MVRQFRLRSTPMRRARKMYSGELDAWQEPPISCGSFLSCGDVHRVAVALHWLAREIEGAAIARGKCRKLVVVGGVQLRNARRRRKARRGRRTGGRRDVPLPLGVVGEEDGELVGRDDRIEIVRI